MNGPVGMLSGVSCCPSIKCVDDSAEAPCWGDVYVVDEDYDGDDYYWVHACEGHADVRMGVPYRPAPTKYLAKAARAVAGVFDVLAAVSR